MRDILIEALRKANQQDVARIIENFPGGNQEFFKLLFKDGKYILVEDIINEISFYSASKIVTASAWLSYDFIIYCRKMQINIDVDLKKKLEEAIATSSMVAYRYALFVTRSRFYAGEPLLKRSSYWSFYKNSIIDEYGPPEGQEP